MKNYLVLVLAALTSFVNAATVEPVGGVELLFIDGNKIKDKRDMTEIGSGPVQFVIKYNKKLDDSGRDRVFDSSPYVVSINDVSSDIVIEAPKLHSYGQADAHFKTEPKWVIKNKSGNNVKYTQEQLDRGDGVFPYYDMPSLVQKHNSKRGLVVGSGAALAASAQDANATIVKVDESGVKKVFELETNNLDQLKAWYLKSSKQERKEFRRWMIDQE